MLRLCSVFWLTLTFEPVSSLIELGELLLELLVFEAVDVLPFGRTRRRQPTSMRFGSVKLFQRMMSV